MLTHIPQEVIDKALCGALPVYVFAQAYNSHEWDVFTPVATNVSLNGIFRCGPAEEISGRSYVRIFGLGADQRHCETAYLDVENVFAVAHSVESAKDLFRKMEEAEKVFLEDMRGPLLKMHTTMAILQAGLEDD